MHASYDDDDRPDWEKAIHPRFTAAEDVDGEGARPSSLVSVYQRSTPDRLHDLNLLRMTQIANDRTMREFGPLPPGGLAVTQKCKPAVPYRDFLGREVREEPSAEENNEMKLSQLAAATALTAGVMAGCADPKHPALNPHPKQSYEITLTIEGAPGPFESVTGFLQYEVVDSYKCAPQDPFNGTYATPVYHFPITFHLVSENTYRGTVHLDMLRDENYYGKGICHWGFKGISASIDVHGVTFGTGLGPEDVAAKTPVTEYMLRKLYSGSDVPGIPDMNFVGRGISDEIAARRNEYFSTTLNAEQSAHE